MIVAGSGVAGLTAALAAAEAGARVTVIEKTGTIGGTSALSGGVAWLPGNHVGDEADSADDARRYLGALAIGDTDPVLIDVFLADAPEVARWVEAVTAMRWQQVPYPDYHAELDGGKLVGRSIEPRPLAVDEALRDRIRPAPNMVPLTYREMTSGTMTREALTRLESSEKLTMGRAMVAALAAACLERGVEILTETAATRLIPDDRGGIRGVDTTAGARYGPVVLATGGFERDPELVKAYLRGPMHAPTGAPGATGDGLRMAIGAGAALGNMSEAWWCPAMHLPGEEIEGEPMFRLVATERARPRSLMVDSTGRRFGNEAQNYNDVGRALHSFDAGEFRYPRVPAWLIFDAGYRSRYHFGPLQREDPDPEWMMKATTIEGLAAAIGADPRVLQDHVRRFNLLAARGVDADYRRGEHPYDRFVGDATAAHPSLGAVADAPFYAVRILPGCLGTKGGPKTDGDGRVQRADGAGGIKGLYAVGNAAASPFGIAYPGAGGTIGPALVYGARCGRAAATDWHAG